MALVYQVVYSSTRAIYLLKNDTYVADSCNSVHLGQVHMSRFRQVFDKGRPMARSALNLDAVREGYRWLALQNLQGHSIPRCGLLVKARFEMR